MWIIFWSTSLSSSADDFHDHLSAPLAGGLDVALDREVKDDFMDLQIVKYYENEVKRHTFASQWNKIMALWYSTVHKVVSPLTGEGRGIMGLHRSWQSWAESSDRAGSQDLPHRPHHGSAQSSRTNAAGPAQAHLCEPLRTTGVTVNVCDWLMRVLLSALLLIGSLSAGFCSKSAEENVSPQLNSRLWSHVWDGLKHPRGTWRATWSFLV